MAVNEPQMTDKLLRVVDIARPTSQQGLSFPAYLSSVQAGFPSPAEDYLENYLNLNEHLVQHPAATFFVRVEGESMADANIFSGDILVVDRSIEAVSGKIVVAIVNGEFTVKRFVSNSQGVFLKPENGKYRAIVIDNDTEFQVWGVVTYVIHKAR